MANLPQYDDDTLMQLQAAGQLSPATIQAIKDGRSPASVPASGGDGYTAIQKPLGSKADQYKADIQQFDSPAGQDSLTDPKGFTTPAATDSAPGFMDTIAAGWNKAKANGFLMPDASAREPAASAPAAAAPSAPSKVDLSQLAIAGAPQPGQTPPMLGQDYGKKLDSIFGQEKAGVQGLADAQSDQAKKSAEILTRGANDDRDYNDAISGTFQDIQDSTKTRLGELDKLGKQVASAQQIDPNRYWHNMSTGGKIASMIGIALGGFGQGYAGRQGNPVMDQINKYIEQDIDAQKTNYDHLRGQLGDKMTMYGLARQQGLDAVTAATAARAAAWQNVQMQLQAQQMRSQDPEVQARAKMQGAEISKNQLTTGMDLQQRIFMMEGLRKAMTGGGIENPMFLPQEMQKNAVKMPNGKYQIANSEDGAKEVAKTQVAAAEMKDTVQKMRQLQAAAGVSLPYTEAKTQAAGLMSTLLFQNQNLEGFKRLSDEDVHQLGQQMYDPTGWRQGLAGKMLDQIDSKIDTKTDSVRQQYIPGYRPIQKVRR